MSVPTANEIETRFEQLPPHEQTGVLRRLNRRLRATPAGWEAGLAAMAVDPQVRGELHQIAREFHVAEGDGLANE